MVRQTKHRSIKKSTRRKTKSKKRVTTRKSRKHLKSKKKNVNSLKKINGNVSGYVHQVKCHNNICSEYKQQISSFDDFNKIFGLFKL